MCGFTGFWSFKAESTKSELLNITQAMNNEIKERGPDSDGLWCDETRGLAFGFRRLAIVDLSPLGNQPMATKSGRLTIVYNGEIYNALELKSELIHLGCQFRGTSDTEVILAACEVWGVVAACKKFIGMFAFALWDAELGKLFLARDRLGIKPLYWGIRQGILFFGSQPKSFLKHPNFSPAIDREALTSYFRFNYVPAPMSIFKDIRKSLPGTILTIDDKGHSQETRFWNFQDVVQQEKISKSISVEAIKDELEVLMKDAVKRRMVADVPLGAFLSGGIDSSTVVALMQSQSIQPIKTFSIGFFEQEYNEAQYAAKVAKHLGTEHHELYLTADDCQKIIPDIPNWCDEPFADVSQIPTFLVSKLAREHVTVSLSGDGGDELFAGYNRYQLGKRIWQGLEYLPIWLRGLGARGIRTLPAAHWDQLVRILPQKLRPQLFGDKAYKLADILTLSSSQAFYRSLMSHWKHPEAISNAQEILFFPWDAPKIPQLDFVENLQFMDTLTYLPDDILFKVDRASMAVGLEARVPLLDHRLVEYVWRLPMEMKIQKGKTKWILRQILNRYVPNHLIERPKMGFGVPIDRWLCGPLRDWAEQLLSSAQLTQAGLDPEPIRQRWQELLSGTRNWQYSVWGVLMFQAWRARWHL